MNTDMQKTEDGRSLAVDAGSVLLALGWQEGFDQFRPYARMFYKRHDTPTRCAGNDDKSGMQVCLYVSDLQGRQSIEMEVCGGLSDGTWLKLHNYSLPQDVHSVLALIPRILAVWESASSTNTKVRDAGGQRPALRTDDQPHSL